MRKLLRTKIENWILADLAIESNDYYALVNRIPDAIHPYDFYLCLEQLVAAGRVRKVKSTPNPIYQLCPTKEASQW